MEYKYQLKQQVNYWGRPHEVIRIGGGIMNTAYATVIRYDLRDMLNEVIRYDVSEIELNLENE